MKTTITRKELKSIYDIACPTWQPRLAKYGAENPFEDEIVFTEKQVQEMVNACTAEQLPIVRGIFEIVETYESLKTVEDCINKLGEKDEEVIQLKKLESIKGLAEYILNNQIAVVIVKALNDGWIPNWDDSSEYKYFPWFYLGKSFRCDAYNYWCTRSSASSRLCLKNKKLAIYAGNQFTEAYKKFMN